MALYCGVRLYHIMDSHCCSPLQSRFLLTLAQNLLLGGYLSPASNATTRSLSDCCRHPLHWQLGAQRWQWLGGIVSLLWSSLKTSAPWRHSGVQVPEAFACIGRALISKYFMRLITPQWATTWKPNLGDGYRWAGGHISIFPQGGKWFIAVRNLIRSWQVYEIGYINYKT